MPKEKSLVMIVTNSSLVPAKYRRFYEFQILKKRAGWFVRIVSGQEIDKWVKFESCLNKKPCQFHLKYKLE